VSDEDGAVLPVAVEEAIEAGVDPETLTDHLGEVSNVIEELTEGTRTGNVCYAQSHVLQRASNVLREVYEEAEVKGEREAEIMALAIILDSEAEEEVF